MKLETKTPSQIVLSYLPDAKLINVGCKNGNYYHVYDGDFCWGKGKSKKSAWKSAVKNLS